MSQLIYNLRQELADLEAEIQQDPRVIKIARIKSLLELYPSDPPRPISEVETAPEIGENKEPATVEELIAGDLVKTSRNGRSDSKASQVNGMVHALLNGGKNLHRSVILDRLVEAGLMGGERNPLASLAAYLSEWRDEFASDGRGNFWLRAESEEVREPRPGAEAPGLLEGV